MFTLALMEILESGKIMALDKSPHALYKIKPPIHVSLEIIDADFNQPLELPELDGIVMANALHYAKDHRYVLQNVLTSLKAKGSFILVEYDTERPNEPWVPNPVSLNTFRKLCKLSGLSEP
jgi:trans-aconitate methyltransferase